MLSKQAALIAFVPALVACAPSAPDTARRNDDEHIQSQSFAFGVSDNDTGKPLGGGEGYGDWVVEINETVHDARGLRSALFAASFQSQYTIYVADDAIIDLTDRDSNGNPRTDAISPIYFPPGVTLASGRGKNGSLGGLLLSQNLVKMPRFWVLSSHDVRITGLRMQGPDTGEEPPIGCFENDSIGIKIEDSKNVRVDNNEMWGWPWVAVYTDKNGTAKNTVSHNHIHHNRRHHPKDSPGCDAYGLGYGVQADHGSTLIEANVFDHNRHNVASGGRPASEGGSTDYEARFNLVLSGGTDSSFDVHGGADADPPPNPPDNVAGGTILIHSNTVLDQYQPNGAVLVRGTPEVKADIFANEFYGHELNEQAFWVHQSNSTGNFFVHDNDWDISMPEAWYVALSGKFPFTNHDGPLSYWAFRRFGKTPPFGMKPIALQDFDGDGKADALRGTGSVWEFSSGARNDFVFRRNSTYSMDQVRFADFNDDQHVDVFAQFDHHWWVSLSASTPWGNAAGQADVPLNMSDYGVEDLGFADFDGNGRCDVFHATGTEWLVSKDGTGPWQPLNTNATIPLKSLGFGRFDGNDTKADVFWANGAEWLVSNGGTQPWKHLNTSGVMVSDLRFADFDGNGVTDVFWDDNGQWKISFNGTGPWEKFASSGFPASDFKFGDVNGDLKTDILMANGF